VTYATPYGPCRIRSARNAIYNLYLYRHQLSITTKGRTRIAIYILDLIAILITRLILSLKAAMTAIMCSAAFLIIRSRIRPIKVVETVPLAVILLMLLTINLE